MNILINYGSKGYGKTQKLNSWTGIHIAKFDAAISYTYDDLDVAFIDKYSKFFEEKRGGGLWIWKPYIILKTIETMNDGDILFYCDAGSFFIRNVRPILDIIKEKDIYVSAIPLIERQFTCMYTFEKMNCFAEKYTESNQVQSGFIGIKKTKKNIELIKLWFEYCSDKLLLKGDDKGIDDSFIAHREDQSILSLLCKMNEIKPHLDPTQYGILPKKYLNERYEFLEPDLKDKYKPMIALHRTPDANFKICFKQFLCCVLPVSISKLFIKNYK